MPHCFRWKIILPPTKRIGIDTSDHTLYEGDAQRVSLGALSLRRTRTSGSCWPRRLRSYCVAAGIPPRTRQPQRLIGGGRYLNWPSLDGISRPTLETAHRWAADSSQLGFACWSSRVVAGCGRTLMR
jgi:hypothetical protein